MAKRARPMPDYFVRSVIAAELRRAANAGRHPDRHYLHAETGIPWHRLDARVAAVRRELREQESAAALASQQTTAEGGAKPGTGPSPKEPRPGPFAPPTIPRKAKP